MIRLHALLVAKYTLGDFELRAHSTHMSINALRRFKNDGNIRKWLQESAIHMLAQATILGGRSGTTCTQLFNNLQVVASTNGYSLTNKQVRHMNGSFEYETHLADTYPLHHDAGGYVLAYGENEELTSELAVRRILEEAGIVIEEELGTLAHKKRSRADGMHNALKKAKMLRDARELEEAERCVAARRQRCRRRGDDDSSSSDDDNAPCEPSVLEHVDAVHAGAVSNAATATVANGFDIPMRAPHSYISRATLAPDDAIAALRKQVLAAAEAAAAAGGGDDISSDEENTVPALCRRTGSSTHGGGVGSPAASEEACGAEAAQQTRNLMPVRCGRAPAMPTRAARSLEEMGQRGEQRPRRARRYLYEDWQRAERERDAMQRVRR